MKILLLKRQRSLSKGIPGKEYAEFGVFTISRDTSSRRYLAYTRENPYYIQNRIDVGSTTGQISVKKERIFARTISNIEYVAYDLSSNFP